MYKFSDSRNVKLLDWLKPWNDSDFTIFYRSTLYFLFKHTYLKILYILTILNSEIFELLIYLQNFYGFLDLIVY